MNTFAHPSLLQKTARKQHKTEEDRFLFAELPLLLAPGRPEELPAPADKDEVFQLNLF